MMFHRTMLEEIKNIATQLPVITLLGPRQSGKTTLVTHAFPQKPYENMESLHVRNFAKADPIGFLEQYPEGAILDEIQEAPELLSYIQVRVDKNQRKGEFILTGSHQIQLNNAIAQSLAGRTAILHMFPLSLEELARAGIHKSLNELLYYGCYPRIHADKLNPTKTYASYVRTYLERDMCKMLQVHDWDLFQKFMVLCASRVGQILNKDGISGEVGITAKTVGHWLSILEACYIIYKLPPYFDNFGKRVIKAPKIYFCDVGLVSYLLGIENAQQLARDPLRGNLFENLVVNELMKARYNQGLEPRFYFYQEAGRTEVDVIYPKGHQLVPIEIKSTQTFNSSLLQGLEKFKKIAPDRSTNGYLIYAGAEELRVGTNQLVNYKNASRIVVPTS